MKIKTNVFLLLILISFSVKAQLQYFGSTYIGGVNNMGTLFNTDSTGTTHTLVYDFPKETKAGRPQNSRLCLGANGKLYGVTKYGGYWIAGSGTGVLFELDTVNNVYTEKYLFNSTDGAHPSSELISASNGKLYGTTIDGGASGYGVIFEYDPITNIFVKKFDFPSTTPPGNKPSGALIETLPGVFYGMTTFGGVSNVGVIYEYDLNTNIYSKKVDFGAIASTPIGGLCLATDGLLYGITKYGGVGGSGLLISYLPGSTTINIVGDFASGTMAVLPVGGVIQSSNGKIYGMTYNGGIYTAGSIYSYNIATGLLSTEFSFSGFDSPYAMLLEAHNGKLYATCNGNGSLATGWLIEFDPSLLSATVVHTFVDGYHGQTNSLMQLPGGKLYGMTEGGTPGGGIVYNGGILFEYDLNTNICKKRAMFGVPRKGYNPNGHLNRGGDGLLYGTTQFGGINDMGVLFGLNISTNSYSVIKEFGSDSTGGSPQQGLLKATNGKLYGITQIGGSQGGGTLFEFDAINGSFNVVYNFNSSVFGKNGKGYLFQASNGKIYGNTQSGGPIGYGCIFEFDPVLGTVIKVHEFDAGSFGTGRAAVGGLIESSTNGKLYGLTSEGGTSGNGVIYEFDPVSYLYVKIYDFSYGKQPMESLVEAVNGKLYGMTMIGGVSNNGTLFEFDPITTLVTTKYEYFGTSNGAWPYSSLIKGLNNLLFGVTKIGGSYNKGTIFSYDPILNIYTKTYNFTTLDGWNPQNGLVSVCASQFPILNVSSPYVCPGDSVLMLTNGSPSNIFQWYYNGSSIVGATDSSYYATLGGSYTIVESALGGCSNQSSSVTILSQLDCDTWPGDVNNDLLVDNNDFLEIGLHYGQTGFSRVGGISNLWQAWESTDWGTTQINGQDIKHADCNGDGIIDNNDTLAVNFNFSLTHTFAPTANDQRLTTPDIYLVTGSSTYMPGDWIDAEVWLGTSSVPVNNLYGIAFNIEYDASLVQSGSESLTYPSSWLGNPGTDAIKLSKIDGIAAKVYGAETRIDHVNSDGFGKIANFKFQLKNTISTSDSLNINIAYYNAVDSVGNPIVFNTQNLTIYISPVGINELEENSEIAIFPNPYSGSTNIYYSLIEKSTISIEIYNTIGQKIETLVSADQNAGEYKYSFSAKEKGYDAGIYFVKFNIDGKIIMRKIVEVK